MCVPEACIVPFYRSTMMDSTLLQNTFLSLFFIMLEHILWYAAAYHKHFACSHWSTLATVVLYVFFNYNYHNFCKITCRFWSAVEFSQENLPLNLDYPVKLIRNKTNEHTLPQAPPRGALVAVASLSLGRKGKMGDETRSRQPFPTRMLGCESPPKDD